MSATVSIRLAAGVISGCHLYPAGPPILYTHGPGFYFTAAMSSPQLDSITPEDLAAARQFVAAVAEWGADIERIVAEGRIADGEPVAGSGAA
jgi:hypothetical protein